MNNLKKQGFTYMLMSLQPKIWETRKQEYFLHILIAHFSILFSLSKQNTFIWEIRLDKENYLLVGKLQVIGWNIAFLRITQERFYTSYWGIVGYGSVRKHLLSMCKNTDSVPALLLTVEYNHWFCYSEHQWSPPSVWPPQANRREGNTILVSLERFRKEKVE